MFANEVEDASFNQRTQRLDGVIGERPAPRLVGMEETQRWMCALRHELRRKPSSCD